MLAIESGELCVLSGPGDVVKELKAGSNLTVMTAKADQEGIFATGGKENPLKVWDIETENIIFTAKNVVALISCLKQISMCGLVLCFVVGT